MAGYGAIEAAHPLSTQPLKRRALSLSVAAAAAALAVIALALVAYNQGAVEQGSVELGFYADKYREVQQLGGNWMTCLKCRHTSDHCHPSRSERTGRVVMLANACPPHTGMTTVLIKKGNELQTRWVSTKKLIAAIKAEADEKDEDEEDKPEKEEEEEEGEPYCVRPEPGMRHLWPKDEDCVPLKEWLQARNAYFDINELGEGGSDEEGGDEDEEGEEGEEGEDEEEDKDEEKWKSPVQKFMDDKVQGIYDDHYGEEDGGDDEAEEEEEEKDKKGGKPDWAVPPRADECFGPANFACQMACFSSCLKSTNRGPVTLKPKGLARQQMLFGVGDLPIPQEDPTGYDEMYVTTDETYGPPRVVPGGNRDFFGINHQR